MFFENSTQLNGDDKSDKDQECDESATAGSPQSLNSASAEEETEIIVFTAREVKDDKSAPNEKTEEETKKIFAESGKDKEQQNSEKTESSDNDDDNSESSSKNSSYLTTSDQRSNEEAGSSLKESDGASKESDSGSKESDNGSGEESKPILMEKVDYSSFSELFVPLSLRVPKRTSDNRPSKQPHWLMKADFNENIKMGYHITSKELDSILESDNRRMVNLMQSSMVHEQLQTLLGEIEDSNSLDAEITAATYDYSGSEKLMDTVPSTPTSTTAITSATTSSATTTSTSTTSATTTSSVITSTGITSTTSTTTDFQTENQEMMCSPSVSLSPVSLSPAPTKFDDVTMSPKNQNDFNANSSSTENVTTNKDHNSESQSDETTDDVLMPLASSSSSYSLPSSSNIVNLRASPSYSIPIMENSSEMPSADKFVSQLEQKAANNSENIDIFDRLFLSTVTEEEDFI